MCDFFRATAMVRVVFLANVLNVYCKFSLWGYVILAFMSDKESKIPTN